jgi:adenylate cyclase
MNNRLTVRAPLWRKLALLAALTAVVPTLAVGIGARMSYEETLRRAALESGLLVAGDLAQTVELEAAQTERSMREIARTLTDPGLDEDAKIGRALALVEASAELDAVAIYDAQGALIDTLRERGAAFEAAPTLPTALSAGSGRADAMRHAPIARRGEVWVWPVALPLVTEGGAVTGVLSAQVPLTRIQARVAHLADERYAGRADSVFVVDGARRVVAHVDSTRVGQEEPAAAFLQQAAGEMIEHGVSYSGAYEGAGGARYLAVFRPVQGTSWGIAAQIPAVVAFGPLQQMERLVALVLAISLAVALLAALLVSRRLLAPMGPLMGMVGALRDRRFDARVQIATQDELAELGDALSGAASDLEQSEAVIRRAQQVRQDLGRYLPRELVERVVAGEQSLALGGERVEVTVLFADVVGFTALCEELGAEEVVGLLNELFTILTEIIFRNGGTVDKFMGDCVMAFWGAPNPQEDHAKRALQAAEEMLGWLEVGNARWSKQLGVKVELAIGVNTGVAVVGNLGSESRMEYTMIGETVNIAARLEAIARPGQILTTAATVDAVGSLFEVVEIGERTLPGQQASMMLYEVQV